MSCIPFFRCNGRSRSCKVSSFLVVAGCNVFKSFVTCFLNEASQEIKVKLNESRLLKFYQVKQLKENSSQNSAEKYFLEDSKLMNSETFRQSKIKQKKKKNTQRTLFPGHSLK